MVVFTVVIFTALVASQRLFSQRLALQSGFTAVVFTVVVFTALVALQRVSSLRLASQGKFHSGGLHSRCLHSLGGLTAVVVLASGFTESGFTAVVFTVVVFMALVASLQFVFLASGSAGSIGVDSSLLSSWASSFTPAICWRLLDQRCSFDHRGPLGVLLIIKGLSI